MIEFENVEKKYKNGFVAVKNINLKVNKGELIALIGPSGCGKTTSMRMINRLVEPTSGTIKIKGENISTINPVQLRRNIGYVIQQVGLFPNLTIGENISLVPKLKKWPAESYLKRVDELLNLVGLEPGTFKDRYPSELSGGQQQRVGVIRALAAEPEIILMDEPFSALDPISREHLQDDIVRLQEDLQKTIVFVTHDIDEAIKIASRIVLMKSGEIIQNDTPEKILRHPANDFVQHFIGEDRLNKEVEVDDILPIASDLMFHSVITIPFKKGLAEAYHMMNQKGVDRLFVIDKERHFMGIVTMKFLKANYQNEVLTVSDILTKEVKTLQADANLQEVADIFYNSDISIIPVLEDDKLVGAITRTSMMKNLSDHKV